jgi:hypothetical protein
MTIGVYIRHWVLQKHACIKEEISAFLVDVLESLFIGLLDVMVMVGRSRYHGAKMSAKW